MVLYSLFKDVTRDVAYLKPGLATENLIVRQKKMNHLPAQRLIENAVIQIILDATMANAFHPDGIVIMILVIFFQVIISNQLEIWCDSKTIHFSDCSDKSDEVNCTMRNCSESEFRCSNGRCIPGRMQCNGEFNCIDFSDEDNCNITCTADEFKCPGHNQFCVPNTWICDGWL